MSRWFLQDGSKVKELTEERLRERLGQGELSGVELAHPEGDLGWRPLHDWPVFAEVVPFTGDPRAAAVTRLQSGFLWHAVSFVGVLGFLISSGGFKAWMIFWAMGLLAHGVRVWTALRTAALPIPDPVPVAPLAVAPALVGPPPQPGFLGEVDAALSELSRVGGERVDVGALSEGAQALQTALMALADAGDPTSGGQLQEALAAAEDRAQAAPDAATAEIYQAEAHAIVARLDAWQDAATAAERLKARQRTLLHQLHALRLDLARGDSPPTAGADPVQAQVRQLRQEAIAAAEVDQDLARARQAQKLR